MPLDYRPVHIPLGVGLNLGANALTMEPPGLTELVNGRVDKDGAIVKRPGYVQRATTGGRAVAWLGSYAGRLLAICYANEGNRVLALTSLVESAPTFTDQSTGAMTSAISEAQQSRQTIARDAVNDIRTPDHCYLPTGHLVVAYASDPFVYVAGSGFDPERVFAQVHDGRPGRSWAAIGGAAENLPVLVPAVDIPSIGSAVSGSVRTRKPRVVPIKQTIASVDFYEAQVVYAVPSLNEIRVAYYDTTLASWNAAAGPVAADAINDLDCAFDAVSIDDDADATGAIWFLAYRTNASSLKIKRFSGGIETHSVTIAEDAECIGLRAISGGVLWVSWYAGTSLRASALSLTDLTATLAPTEIYPAVDISDVHRIGVVCLSTTKALVCWSEPEPPRADVMTRFQTVTTTGALGYPLGIGFAPDRLRFVLESRPVVHGEHVYVVVRYDGRSGSGESEGFSSLHLVSLARVNEIDTGGPRTQFRDVAQTQLARATGSRGRNHVGMLRSFGEEDFPLWFATDVAFRTAQLRSDGMKAISFSGVDVVTWVTKNSYPNDRRGALAPMSRQALLAGAVPAVYDGQIPTEHYFAWPPENAEMSLDVGAGGLSAGDYQVAVVWEYRTNAGDRMMSPPTFARTTGGDTSITAAAGDAIEVTLPPLTLTLKCDDADATSLVTRRGAIAKLYRTIANGDVLYEDPDENAQTRNVPYFTSTVLTLRSNAADSLIETNAVLYTVSGELEHYPFPALDCVCTHDNRWFGIPSDDPYAVVFSSAQALGEVPWHHPAFEIRLDEDGPNIAIASLDDKLVVFKRGSVWVVTGQGPAADGSNATYTAQRLASADGCIERRSVVVTADGVYFQGRAGLYLVNRGLSVALVSGPVDALFDGTVVIMSATLVADRQEIYWTARRTKVEQPTVLDDPETVHTPLTIVYNVQNKQWSVDYVKTSDGDDGGQLAAACYHTSHNGAYYHVSHGDSAVLIHIGFADPVNTWIPLRVTTAWIKLAGLQGYQRVRWLGIMGEHARPYLFNLHGWTARVAYDYKLSLTAFDPEPQFEQEHEFEAGHIFSSGMDSHSERLHLSRQKCQSILVQIEDVQPDGADPCEGAKLVSLVLDVGLKKSLYPAPQFNMQRTGS